jgi:hypothetical protein
MQQGARSGDLMVIGHSSGGGALQYAHARGIIEARCAQSARCGTSLWELRCTLELAENRLVVCLAQSGAIPKIGLTTVSWLIIHQILCAQVFYGKFFRVRTMDGSLWKNGLATWELLTNLTALKYNARRNRVYLIVGADDHDRY